MSRSRASANVGYRLARHLHEAGANLWVTDIHAPAVERAVAEFGAKPVAMDEIHALDVDVFAPCALGAVLNERTIPQIRGPGDCRRGQQPAGDASRRRPRP